ncbi:MAG: 16S rRNA (uracil(1498)-N(3))-methyltransferase [Streptosporangiales bacterium]|nr:16S rRNA (uracil(1498)-N(3))-methyltransferase [Streptosporangiales bacterium]
MTAPVFIASAGLPEGDRVVLDGPEGRHAATVRRLRPGERADLTDGAGLLAECVVVAAGKDTVELEVLRRRHSPEPDPRLVVAQALPKGDRGELAVELMTEAGVDAVIPWAAARCVTRWKAERGAKALGRWRSTAREAAKQARRDRLPVVTEQEGTAALAARLREAELAVVLHESAETPLSAVTPPATGEVVAVVGPEGGIDDAELATFTEAGAVPVRLGGTVLRTSTAGLAALAVLSTRTGRW